MSIGYSQYWISQRQLARRYNVEGPEAMHNRYYTRSHRAAPLLSPQQVAELATAVRDRRQQAMRRRAHGRGVDKPPPRPECWMGDASQEVTPHNETMR